MTQHTTHAVAKRSGWPISDGDPQPGDMIETPGALSTAPRGPEKYAWFPERSDGTLCGSDGTTQHDDYETYVGSDLPLKVVPIEEDPPSTPACCGFCSPPSAIAERGVYQPDYKLVAVDDTAVVYTCHACIVDAQKVD